MLRRSRADRARRRRLDRETGYGAGFGSEHGCEWLTLGGSRAWVCSRARGRTLELAVGTGLNLRSYPDDVELVAVDLQVEHLEIAADRARETRPSVRLAVADCQRLPFGDDAFDTVVCTLAICDVHDRTAALTEAFRVVRPGGLLLLLDHYEKRWRRGRPATVAARVGFEVLERQRLWAGYFERVRLHKPASPSEPLAPT